MTVSPLSGCLRIARAQPSCDPWTLCIQICCGGCIHTSAHTHTHTHTYAAKSTRTHGINSVYNFFKLLSPCFKNVQTLLLASHTSSYIQVHTHTHARMHNVCPPVRPFHSVSAEALLSFHSCLSNLPSPPRHPAKRSPPINF